MADIERLVVGLGNPGEEYENTPHNLGFHVIDALAGRHAIRVTRKENMSLVGLGSIGATKVALAKPQTYMNLSGGAVKGLVERYELTPDRVIVVYDELDLPWGTLRIKPRGSAAGHNGVKSLISSLGTNNFVRVRVGVWHERQSHERTGGRDGAKFVLGQFHRSKKEEVEETVGRAADAVESILAEGVEKSMTVFNRRAQGLTKEEE